MDVQGCCTLEQIPGAIKLLKYEKKKSQTVLLLYHLFVTKHLDSPLHLLIFLAFVVLHSDAC